MFSTEAASAATVLSMNRRRAKRRSPHRVPCRLTIFGKSPGTEWATTGQTVNISPDGVAVQLGRALPGGVPVEVMVPQLDGDPLYLLGTVVHSRRVSSGTFEVGIRKRPERDPHWP